MKITIEQHGIKTSVEYHDDGIDVYQLGALVHSALTGVGWSEINLENIMKQDEFNWDFVVERETEKS